jgi:hypothetical protein
MLRRSEAGDDAFREQHQKRAAQLKDIDGTRRPVLVNEAESPLGWLKSRKDRNGRPLISDSQYEAGERLRTDYWFARQPAGDGELVGACAVRAIAARRSGERCDCDEVAAKERVIASTWTRSLPGCSSTFAAS